MKGGKMRKACGFIFIEIHDGRRYLFGKAVNDTGWPFENLQTNGIATFNSLPEMRVAKRRIPKERTGNFREARLEMDIAEKPEDLECLANLPKGKRFYVIVQGEGEEVCLVGEGSANLPGSFDGRCDLSGGGKPFKDFQRADYCAGETKRQSLSRVTLASFLLEEID